MGKGVEVMHFRSDEDTSHDMSVGIPLPMYVVDDRGGEVERLRARVEELEDAARDVIHWCSKRDQWWDEVVVLNDVLDAGTEGDKAPMGIHDLKVQVFSRDGAELELQEVYTRYGFGSVPPVVRVLLAGPKETRDATLP